MRWQAIQAMAQSKVKAIHIWRTKFSERLSEAGLAPTSIVDDLRKLAVVVSPSATPRVIAADADDDHVLAAASADKRHLLPLVEHQGIPIVTAREAVAHLEARGKT